MRPATDSIYVPSARLREQLDDFDSFDQNFRQTELEWNHGASQDEWELKEAYLDVDLSTARLWLRIGKQTIVWGKTELFRNQDQFNPVDLALASLPSLEESPHRALVARGDLVASTTSARSRTCASRSRSTSTTSSRPTSGAAASPTRPGSCAASRPALWAHGVTGLGIAGEEPPPDPWDSSLGHRGRRAARVPLGPLQLRAHRLLRLRRLRRPPTLQLLLAERRPASPAGRSTRSAAPLEPDTALRSHPGNRQLFEFSCEATLGFGSKAASALAGGEGVIPDL